jgi:hypothetical protein
VPKVDTSPREPGDDGECSISSASAGVDGCTITTGPPGGDFESLLLRRACPRSKEDGGTVDDCELTLFESTGVAREELPVAVTDGAKRTPRLFGNDGTRCNVLAGAW